MALCFRSAWHASWQVTPTMLVSRRSPAPSFFASWRKRNSPDASSCAIPMPHWGQRHPDLSSVTLSSVATRNAGRCQRNSWWAYLNRLCSCSDSPHQQTLSGPITGVRYQHQGQYLCPWTPTPSTVASFCLIARRFALPSRTSGCTLCTPCGARWHA